MCLNTKYLNAFHESIYFLNKIKENDFRIKKI